MVKIFQKEESICDFASSTLSPLKIPNLNEISFKLVSNWRSIKDDLVLKTLGNMLPIPKHPTSKHSPKFSKVLSKTHLAFPNILYLPASVGSFFYITTSVVKNDGIV